MTAIGLPRKLFESIGMRVRHFVVATPSSFACLLFVVMTSGPACSSPPAANECSLQNRTSCPDPSLSYDAGIGATLSSNCSPCHAEGGVEASVRLTDYGNVSTRLTSIAGQLASCSMPPAGSPQLTTAERQMLFDWIVCGAPR